MSSSTSQHILTHYMYNILAHFVYKEKYAVFIMCLTVLLVQIS